MKKAALAVLAMAFFIGLLVTFGRYEYINRPDVTMRVDRITGRAFVLRKVGYQGGVEWVPLPTKEEAQAAAVRAWGTPAPKPSPQ